MPRNRGAFRTASASQRVRLHDLSEEELEALSRECEERILRSQKGADVPVLSDDAAWQKANAIDNGFDVSRRRKPVTLTGRKTGQQQGLPDLEQHPE